MLEVLLLLLLLLWLLLLLLQVLEARCNSRTSRVVEEVFRRVAVGIQNNLGFTPEALLIFVHEVLSDSIPQLASDKPKASVSSDLQLRPPDHRLLPSAPERSGPRPVHLGNVGASIITEFGLQVRSHIQLLHRGGARRGEEREEGRGTKCVWGRGGG